MSPYALDVYRRSGTRSAPVIVSLHGGSGTKTDADYVELSRRLAAEGMVVFNVAYAAAGPPAYAADNGRLLGRELERVVCSIRYASAHASRFGGEGDRVAIVAHSAGGFFGLLAALSAGEITGPWDGVDDPSSRGITCAEPRGSAEVSGFVGLNGAHFVFAFWGVPENDPALWQAIDPASHLGRRPSLATRFILGANDPSTPPAHVQMVEAFSADRQGLGADSEVVTIDTGHDYSFAPAQWDATLAAIRAVLGSG